MTSKLDRFLGGLAITLTAGCVDVGAEPITVPIYVAGTSVDGPITGKAGVPIELDRAELAFGPLYLCAGVQAGELCETARLEWLDAVGFDVLAATPIEAGQLRGREGTVRSWMFDLGVVSLLTEPKPLIFAAAEQLGDASLVIEGRANVDGIVIPFVVELVVSQDEATEVGIPVVRKSSGEVFEHEVTADEPGLLVRFDPRPWVTQIDFAGLLEDRSCSTTDAPIVCAGQTEQTCDVDGNVLGTRPCTDLDQVCVHELGCVAVVEFAADSQGYRAVRNQVVAGERPQFEWGFEP